MVLSILLSIASVIVVDYESVKFGFYNAYHMVNDSNKLLAVTTSILIFIYFLNIRIHYSSIINMIGASTFSILLIHANGDAVKEFLWDKVFNTTIYFYSNYLVEHALLSVLIVFFVSFVIDLIRIKVIKIIKN